MPNPRKDYKVNVKVKSVRGSECALGFKEGDSWLIKENGILPEGMCNYVWGAIAVPARVFRLGGELPWDNDKDTSFVCCPSAQSRVIFEVKRIRENNP